MTHTTTAHSTRDIGATRANLLLWLQSIGYKPSTATFLSEVAVERGSRARNGFAYSGRQWYATVNAKFTATDDGCDVELGWEMSTLGQLGSKPDMAFWKTEIALTQEAASSGRVDLAKYIAAVSQNSRGNMVLIAIFLAGILGPLAPFLATGNPSNLVLGGVTAIVLATVIWLVVRGSRDLSA